MGHNSQWNSPGTHPLPKAFPGHFLIPQKEAGNALLSDLNGLRLFSSLKEAIHENFNAFKAHIFIFSTGIAVRMIAPLLASKLTDPAVVVLDEKGCHAISLISGHLGGANELARHIAEITNAVPVITTATDINQLPSVDMIARDAGLFIETPESIKYVNMKLLKGEPLVLVDPLNRVHPKLPEHLITKTRMIVLTSSVPGKP